MHDYQLVELRPGLDLVVGHVQRGELAQAPEAVQRGDEVVGEPELLERLGHVLQLLDLRPGRMWGYRDRPTVQWQRHRINSNLHHHHHRTFLIWFRPRDRMRSLRIPASETMRSIWLVESESHLRGYN